MRSSVLAVLTTATALLLFSSETPAQPGGGGGGGMCAGMSGGGAGMAGGFGRGNGMTAGNANGFMALNMLSQMAQAQVGRQRGPAGNNGPAAQRNQRPSAAQFTRTAMRFDQNEDRQLDEDELNQVAVAVIRELQSRRGRPPARQAASVRPAESRVTTQPDTREMQEAFVSRALQFDRDGDGALSQSETTRMARALIRTLS